MNQTLQCFDSLTHICHLGSWSTNHRNYQNNISITFILDEASNCGVLKKLQANILKYIFQILIFNEAQ